MATVKKQSEIPTTFGASTKEAPPIKEQKPSPSEYFPNYRFTQTDHAIPKVSVFFFIQIFIKC